VLRFCFVMMPGITGNTKIRQMVVMRPAAFGARTAVLMWWPAKTLKGVVLWVCSRIISMVLGMPTGIVLMVM
jgi:hypothetical protein